MTLIFVYNAKSAFLNKAIDFARKILTPSKFDCELCALTHHKLGERMQWKTFNKESNAKFNFYYSQEFEGKFNLIGQYPVIYKESKGELIQLMSSYEIENCKNVTELITRLEDLNLT
tara:strand:+ start:4609 stop:4959 length:351 start_codon:yes stop_codon:yes gene_type:complete